MRVVFAALGLLSILVACGSTEPEPTPDPQGGPALPAVSAGTTEPEMTKGGPPPGECNCAGGCCQSAAGAGCCCPAGKHCESGALSCGCWGPTE